MKVLFRSSGLEKAALFVGKRSLGVILELNYGSSRLCVYVLELVMYGDAVESVVKGLAKDLGAM